MTGMATKLIVIGGFLVAFAAGMVTGLQQSPPSTVNANVPLRNASTSPTFPRGGPVVGDRGRGNPRMPPPPSILDRELNLDADQRTKLEAVWKDVAMVGVREMEQNRQQLRRERDEAVTELLEQEAAVEYEKILVDYQQRLAALENKWWEQYSSGVDRTKSLLSPQQLERFEQIMRRNTWDPEQFRRGGGGRGGRGGGGPGGNRGGPTTRSETRDSRDGREDRGRN